jgi:hypothetical protein
MIRFVKNPSFCEHLGENALIHIATCFSEERFREKIKKIFDEIWLDREDHVCSGWGANANNVYRCIWSLWKSTSIVLHLRIKKENFALFTPPPPRVKVKKYFSPLSFPLFLLFSVFCLRRGKNERTEKTATNRLRKEYVRLCRVFERSSQVTTISSPSQNSRY